MCTIGFLFTLGYLSRIDGKWWEAFTEVGWAIIWPVFWGRFFYDYLKNVRGFHEGDLK